MEFPHAARDGIDPRLELGGHVAPCIAPLPVRPEAQRKKAPALRTGQARLEGRGFAALRHAPLQYELLAGREMSQVLAQRRNVVTPNSAVATDVGFGDQRKFETRAG